MTIIVELDATPNRKGPTKIELDSARSVAQAIERLELAPDSGYVILVNGRVSHWNAELQDGDVVQLIRAIGGG